MTVRRRAPSLTLVGTPTVLVTAQQEATAKTSQREQTERVPNSRVRRSIRRNLWGQKEKQKSWIKGEMSQKRLKLWLIQMNQLKRSNLGRLNAMLSHGGKSDRHQDHHHPDIQSGREELQLGKHQGTMS